MFGVTIGKEFEGKVLSKRTTPYGITNYVIPPPEGQEDIWAHFEVAVDASDRVCSFSGGVKIHDSLEKNTEQDIVLAKYIVSKAGRATKESDANRIRTFVAPGYRLEWENINSGANSDIPEEIGHMLYQIGKFEMSSMRGYLIAIGKKDCFGKKFRKSEVKF